MKWGLGTGLLLIKRSFTTVKALSPSFVRPKKAGGWE